jgi:hypothetical protein
MKPAEKTVPGVFYVVVFLMLAGSWVLWQNRYFPPKVVDRPHVSASPSLGVTSAPTLPKGASAPASPGGASVSPEQRTRFVREFSGNYLMGASVSTSGDSIFVKGGAVNAALIAGMMRSEAAMHGLRSAGFRHLIMTDGRNRWNIEVQN